MNLVCLYVTIPRNPVKGFSKEQRQDHLDKAKILYPKADITKVIAHVVKADFRLPHAEVFRQVIKDALGEDGILSVQYQTGLSYIQKQVSYGILRDLLKHKNVFTHTGHNQHGIRQDKHQLPVFHGGSTRVRTIAD